MSDSKELESAFSDIYGNERWGKGQGSGEGSNADRNSAYIRMLQAFMREMGVRSVVDVGCGDWQFSKGIDWTGIDYLGIDVVGELVETLTETYARPGVRFMQGNAAACDLPRADLLIVKDVLQHLPIKDIQAFLDRLPLFRHAILTNDRRQYRLPSWRNLWNLRPVDMAIANVEIPGGGYRPLRLRDAPFCLEATELATFKMWHTNGIHIKESLLWENQSGTQNGR